MARCEKCGKECTEGDLCSACRNELKYYYVSKLEKKRPKRSLRARMRAWWWPIRPEDRKRHNKLALIAAVVFVLLLVGLLLIFPRFGSRTAIQAGGRSSEGEIYGSVR